MFFGDVLVPWILRGTAETGSLVPRVQISENFLQLNARSTSYCRCIYASDFERCRIVSSGANF